MNTTNPLLVPCPLDVLRLGYPHHAITLQVLWGKQFYVAQACERYVRPVYAQAETVVGLRDKLRRAAVRGIDTSRPSTPRVYDFLLGGKDNFATDRIQAEALLDIFPRTAELARQSRQFQRCAVAWTARAGISQFIDLGCGLPTPPNTHETARHVQPGAPVAYVDNDDMALSHARSLLAGDGGITVLDGDLACPREVFYDGRLRHAIDLNRPVCVVLTAILHFFGPATSRRIVAEISEAIAPGSYLIVSVVHAEGDLAERATAEYQPARLYHHDPDGLAHILTGLQITPQKEEPRMPATSAELMPGIGIKTGNVLIPSFLELEITGFCQLKCIHCYAESGPRGGPGTMATGDWESVIGRAAEIGVKMLQFIGGEPALDRRLPRFVRHALGKGLKVYVYSNLVHVPPELWELFSQPGVFLGTSWYSASPEKHARITGSRASYARTRANIAEAVRRGIPVRAAIVAIRPDQDTGQAMAELRRLGVTDIRIRPSQAVGRAAHNGSGEDVAELCGNCGLDRAAILPDGQLTPCAIARWLEVGNVRRTPLADLLSGPAWRHTLALVPRHTNVSACGPAGNCPPASDGNDCPPASCR